MDKETGCWAALVVTPIMSRTQSFESASEIIFVDSTASCDTTRCTVTEVLAATSAGAVPVATLGHNSQTTEGYMTAFGLFKSSYPFCFGGRQVSTHRQFFTIYQLFTFLSFDMIRD